MANVGTASPGQVLIGQGQGASPTFASIGTSSGLTAHSIVVSEGNSAFAAVGPGISGQLFQSKGAGVDPAYTTATYPSTTVANQLLFSSANNVISGLASANNGVLITSATGIPSVLQLNANGQLLIGSGAGAPAAATLTAGTGITITNAANSITINAVGGGFTWSVVTVDASFIVNTGTIANKAGLLTMTLPATANIGDMIRITGENNATGWKVAQNANQQIFIGSTQTTVGVGGSLASSATRDSIEMVCTVAGASTVWTVLASIGNITVV